MSLSFDDGINELLRAARLVQGFRVSFLGLESGWGLQGTRIQAGVECRVLGCVVRCQVAALWQFCPADIARHAFFRAGWRLFLYQGASFVPTPRRLTQDAFMVRDGRRLWWCPKTSLNTTRKCGSVPRRDTLRCLRGGALLSVYSYLVCVCVHVLRIKDEG